MGPLQGPGYRAEFYLDALRRCASSLEVLTLRMQASRTTSTLQLRSYAPVHLPNLKHVTLLDNMHLMLPFIAAPKLAHIVLSGSREGDPDGDAFVSLLGFLDAAGSNLVTTLDIKDITGASALNLVHREAPAPQVFHIRRVH